MSYLTDGAKLCLNMRQLTVPDCGSVPHESGNSVELRGLQWYAVHTVSRHEKRVHERLLSIGLDSLLPTYHTRQRYKSGEIRRLELPLFPGYVFARFVPDHRFRILNLPSVAAIVGFGGKPCAIPQAEIDAISAVLPTFRVRPHPFMRIGQRVRVKRTAGALAGLEGLLVRESNGARFILCVDLIGQAIAVEIDSGDLEPLT